MKKVIVLAIALVFVMAGLAFATVVGGQHDLSDSGPLTDSTNTNQICVFCHAPHNNYATVKPLWNHELSASNFNVYGGTTDPTTSATLDGAAEDFTGADALVSALCLSCHDGTVSVISILSNPVATGAPTVGTGGGTELTAGTYELADPAKIIGTGGNLYSEHPINIEAGTDADVGALVAGGAITGAVSGATYPLFAGTGALADTVQCGTCHDAHDNGGASPFLRATVADSTICLDCHTTK